MSWINLILLIPALLFIEYAQAMESDFSFDQTMSIIGMPEYSYDNPNLAEYNSTLNNSSLLFNNSSNYQQDLLESPIIEFNPEAMRILGPPLSPYESPYIDTKDQRIVRFMEEAKNVSEDWPAIPKPIFFALGSRYAILPYELEILFDYAGPAAPNAVGQPFFVEKDGFDASCAYAHPRVAFDGTNFLVVWTEQTKPFKDDFSSYRLMGARISPNGDILDPGGFVITEDYGKYDYFDLAFGGNTYLVVWERDMGYASGYLNVDPISVIAAARVSKAGKVLDTTPIIIDKDPSSAPSISKIEHSAPEVIFTGSDFLVAYIRCMPLWSLSPVGTMTQDGIFARFVTTSGTVTPGKTKLLSITPDFVAYRGMGLEFNPVYGEGFLTFLVMDISKWPNVNSIQGIMLDLQGSTLTASSPVLIQETSTFNWFDYPAIGTDGKNSYLVVYEDPTSKTNGWPDISGALINTKSIQLVQYLGNIVKGQSEDIPSVAFDGKSYSVVYTHYEHSTPTCGLVFLGATRVNPAGQVGSSTFYNTWANLLTSTSIASGNSNCLVVFNQEIPASSPLSGGSFSVGVAGQFLDKIP